jgi:hypothetical protein
MEDGRMVGGEEWQEKVYDREEWKKLLRMARNRRILHMPVEQNRITAVSWSITIAYSNSELNYEIINTSARFCVTPWME